MNQPLIQFLSQRDPAYAAKVGELRTVVEAWLEHVSDTFPHYTRHTVAHSDEIVGQISSLLFHEGDPTRPVINLSAAEAYVLAAASFLHDVGMVVSDAEKAEILASEDWIDWTSEGGEAHGRIREIHAFRQGRYPSNDDLRNFLADVQLRFLLAEFVRRSHHTRAVPVLADEQGRLARFAFDDPLLLETIASVCVGHGLDGWELDDPLRYPDRRDVRGETVNVRLMAILLRLGDLLDLSHDRACPLVLGAVSPLPPESIPHWSQYQRISHRSTAPDAIEIHAECDTADEHRLLQDWCQWIVREVERSRTLMASSRRHGEWSPPTALIAGQNATITIRPSAAATYIPSRWTFELDAEAVVSRLVSDVSSEPLLFVRELIQNSLDASRCHLFDDLKRRGGLLPESPDLAPSEDRARYPLSVSLSDVAVPDPLTGDMAHRQVITVEDCGVGMSEEVIRKYFLQIGRSFYTTPQFRREYAFTPTSRFGVGFLSVFRDSDHVEVETATDADLAAGSGGLKLSLTGPRNYLLTERGSRSSAGTKISVQLRSGIRAENFGAMVAGLCRRVEFPVHVTTPGSQTVIEAERSEDFQWRVERVDAPEAYFEIRAIPFAEAGVRGELYVFVHRREDGSESWVDERWARGAYLTDYPEARVPASPMCLRTLNGLTLAEYQTASEGIDRLDIRRPVPDLGLARAMRGSLAGDVPEVERAWERALTHHISQTALSRGVNGWRYLQALMRLYPRPELWLDLEDTVRAHVGGEPATMSVAEAGATNRVTVLQYIGPGARAGLFQVNHQRRRVTRSDLTARRDTLVLPDWDLNSLSAFAREKIMAGRAPVQVRRRGRRFLAITWQRRDAPDVVEFAGEPAFVVDLGNNELVGFPVHLFTGSQAAVLLNRRSKVVKWLKAAAEHANRSPSPVIDKHHLETVFEKLRTPLTIDGYKADELEQYVQALGRLDLPRNLRPPPVPVDERSYMARGVGDR